MGMVSIVFVCYVCVCVCYLEPKVIPEQDTEELYR